MSRKDRSPQSLTLRYRLPNPPGVFVGRERESQHLENLIRTCPVAVVWGLGGIGKTALVLHTLRRAFPEQASRTLFLRVWADQPLDQVRLELARALAQALGVEQVDWLRLQTDPEALVATALDLAEGSGWWVVLDDIHHCAPMLTEEILLPLSRYARESRWLATSRVDPQLPDLAGQVLSLGAMELEDLGALARGCDPDLTDSGVERLVAESGGSPWRLRQLVVGAGNEESARDPLRGLPQSGVGLLEALTVVKTFLPPDEVARFVELPEPAVLDQLERRGFLERSPLGVRLHDAASGLIKARLDPGALSERRDRAITGLAASGHAVATLEAVRLSLHSDDIARARQVLDLHGKTLLLSGYAPSLWRLVEDRRAEELARWRLRCAVELGSPQALAEVREPQDADAEIRLLWARALFGLGRLQEAAEICAEVHGWACERDEQRLAFDSAVLQAHCIGHLGHFDEAFEIVRALPADEPDDRARADVYAARIHVHRGEFPECLALVEALTPRLGELSPTTRRDIQEQLAVILYFAGRIKEASRLLTRLVAADERLPYALYHNRANLAFRAGLAVRAGRLGEAEELLERMSAYADRASIHRTSLTIFGIQWRICAGRIGGLDEMIEDLRRAASEAGDVSAYQHSFVLEVRLGLLRGSEPVDLEPAKAMGPLAGRNALLLKGYHLWCLGKRGEPVHRDLEEMADRFDTDLDLGIIARLALADAYLAAGDGGAAFACAEEARRAAQEQGCRAYEADAQQILCDALLVLGKVPDALQSAMRLAEIGSSFPSRRSAAEAELYAVLATEEVPRPAALERIADLEEVAPLAARRAAAFLGGPARLDRVDEAVLSALSTRHGGWRIEVLGERDAAAGSWTRGWGIDTRRHEVWLPDGQTLVFASESLIWRTLEALIAGGGAATKADIVEKVWNEEFHPLRHKNRLHTTINKLRQQIEVNPHRPQRLVTTEEGYRFGEGAPVRLLRLGDARRRD